MSFENDGNVIGRVTYLGASVESSLYRNGKVFTHHDRNGNDDAYYGAVMEQRDVVINDARRLEYSRRRQLGAHGLELLHRPLQRLDLDFFDNRQVVQEYYPQCVSAYPTENGTRFAVVLIQRPGSSWAVPGPHCTATEYRAEFERWTAQGYMALSLCGYPWQGDIRYTGVFVKL